MRIVIPAKAGIQRRLTGMPISEQSNKEPTEQKDEWGFTFGENGEGLPAEGYVYSTHGKDDNAVFHEDALASQKFLSDLIDEFKIKNKRDFENGAYLGIWKSGDSVHLDVVRIAGSEKEALAEAKKYKDIAICDIKNNKTIYIK